MSRREMGDAAITHVESTHTHPVLMGKFLFDTPEYLHTGLGSFPFEGNTYQGIGTLAGFSGLSESENIVPAPVQVSLSGLATEFFDEALSAANYGDKVTLYLGYRNDSGLLRDDALVIYKGTVETGGVEKGIETNSARFTLQHVLAILRQSIGTKWTNEAQQKKYTGDLGFEFVEKMRTLRLSWGAKDPSESVGGHGPPRASDEYRGQHGDG